LARVFGDATIFFQDRGNEFSFGGGPENMRTKLRLTSLKIFLLITLMYSGENNEVFLLIFCIFPSFIHFLLPRILEAADAYLPPLPSAAHIAQDQSYCKKVKLSL
jgi:hypothetical protein